MSLKDLQIIKPMFPNVFCLQTNSYRTSIIGVAALGPVAACPCITNDVRRPLVGYWLWMGILLHNFFFPLRKQTECSNMGHFYTQGEFQSLFLFGNSKRETGSLQSKVKHGLPFPFKERYWVWDGLFFYIWDISKFLLKNVKMLSRMAIFSLETLIVMKLLHSWSASVENIWWTQLIWHWGWVLFNFRI